MKILNNQSTSTDLHKFAGGKATQLASLSEILDHTYCTIPFWICLSQDYFLDFVDKFDRDFLKQSGHEEIENAFLSMSLNSDLKESLYQNLQHGLTQGWSFAVRSSAVGEDSREHSFAGQFSTYLFQKSIMQIEESIKKCWASAFSDRSKSYSQQLNIFHGQLAMAVIIQKMVNAQVAGVAFSRDPINALNREDILISSCFGVGEGLVSGELAADHFIVNRSNHNQIRSEITKKEFYYTGQSQGGVLKKEVPLDQQSLPSLNTDFIKDISQAIVQIEDHYQVPQDIEWAIENGSIYLLQTRAITNLPNSPYYQDNIKGENLILWDNSNITESYNGVTSPLTFSHISRAYRQVYLQYCEVMGVPSEVIAAHDSTFRNMLGFIRGRVYYNLGNWYRMIFLFPFAGTSKGFMDTMMGVKQQLKPEFASLFDFTKNPPRYPLTRSIYIFFRNSFRLLKVKKLIIQFKKDFDLVYQKAKRQDYSHQNIQELLSSYDQLNQDLLFKWKAPIISDTRCMIFFGLLKSLTEKWIAADSNGGLYNDLLSAQGDLPSTEPTRWLMKIAHSIALDEQLKSWFLTTSTHEIIKSLGQGQVPKLNEQLNAFIDHYGFRCINELKLESIDLHEDPSFCVEAIKSFLKMNNTSVDEIIKKERATYEKALSTVNNQLTGIKSVIFNFILKQARRAVKDREDLRLLRTNIFGICRRIFKALGHKLYQLDLIEQPLDIFYLTIEELYAYQEGRSFEVSFKELANTRKEQFEHFKKTPAPPDRFYTKGTVGVNLRYPQILSSQDLYVQDQEEIDNPDLLKGTPCCPGIVEGIVRIVSEMEDAVDLNGEIMVCERTDPGWVPLFPSTSGLLIERGSLLSHSAIVARELGIPTIVGIKGGLLKKLKNGMRIKMDATNGIILIQE